MKGSDYYPHFTLKKITQNEFKALLLSGCPVEANYSVTLFCLLLMATFRLS